VLKTVNSFLEQT